MSGFRFDGMYDPWRESRLRGLRKYISPDVFEGKTLLELGCGHADNGIALQSFGCKVDVTDAREEHLDVVRSRYPSLNVYKLDADHDEIPKKYDIILHWGMLYHIAAVDTHMADVLSKCDILLLETEVSDTTEIFTQTTNEAGPDQAFNGIGSRPSAGYIHRIFETHGFQYRMIKDSVLNSDYHIYDWEPTNTRQWKHGLRRYWIAWKSQCPIRPELL